MFDGISSRIIDGVTFATLRVDDTSGNISLYDLVFTDASKIDEVYWASVIAISGKDAVHTQHSVRCK